MPTRAPPDTHSLPHMSGTPAVLSQSRGSGGAGPANSPMAAAANAPRRRVRILHSQRAGARAH
eukprot:491144-Pyramimonas_sp.AAC.1